MKVLLGISILVAGFAAPAMAAGPVVVKTCSTTVFMPGEGNEPTQSMSLNFSIVNRNDQLMALVDQEFQGQKVSRPDSVKVQEAAVRAGLNVESNIEELNVAEGLIVHAMALATDPVFKGTQNAGLDLSAVRSAKIYLIGEAGVGSTSIVEAKDADGKDLGSFLGGFLLSPCK